jgi:hypothetical protein
MSTFENMTQDFATGEMRFIHFAAAAPPGVHPGLTARRFFNS